jgi:NOL1/NOP2/sun family putative RNA methylase
LPPAYLDRMQGLLGDEYPAFLASYGAPGAQGLRANTLKVTPNHLRALAPFGLAPLDLLPEAFLVEEEAAPGRHPYHAAGLYYLQDPSAMAVAPLLDPRPGERVLDLAAAPGGKATHIAARMAGQGILFANEIHPKRAWDLAENLERWGVRNAVVLNEDPARLAERLPGYFDRVLLDAPCSGEGLFRKTPAARLEWSPALVAGCARRQSALLAQAAELVRPGGVLAYATCTFAPEEDEEVIARFLDAAPDFALVAPLRLPGLSSARPGWADGGSGTLSLAVRLWPHTGPGEGHFIAVMRRAGGDQEVGSPMHRRAAAPLPKPAEALYRDFCERHLARPPADGRPALAGSYLYALPDGLPDLTGLRAIHPGWWLGVLRKDRFEPSHALALGLTAAGAARLLDLRPDDDRLRAYLQGNAFADAGEDGWVLVTVDGFPVGWGKRTGDMLKSHYPKGLRRP